MGLKFPPLKRLLLLLFVIVPILAWFFVKPMRVLYPTSQDVTCVSAWLCVDDPGQAEPAAKLYNEAFAFVSESITTLKTKPRLIFCSTDACANNFGLKDRAAVAVGTFGTVIGPRAWAPYLVRHEMIHYLQCEQLGVLKVMRMPDWFVEGMAYSLSKDPRDPLPEPLESYRSAFESWDANTDDRIFWRVAGRL